jgi:hypothetical protein
MQGTDLTNSCSDSQREGSVPSSQSPASGPYPDWHKQPTTSQLISLRSLSVLSYHLPNGLFPSVILQKKLYEFLFSPTPVTCTFISFCLIWPSQLCTTRTTHHAAPRHVVSSSYSLALHPHHHKHQGLDPLIGSVSRVTTALANVSSVSQLSSFLVVCSDTISKESCLVAFL